MKSNEIKQILLSKSAKQLNKPSFDIKESQRIQKIKDSYINDNINFHYQTHEIEDTIVKISEDSQQKINKSKMQHQLFVKQIQELLDEVKQWQIGSLHNQNQVDIKNIQNNHKHQASKIVQFVQKEVCSAKKAIQKLNQTVNILPNLLSTQKREISVSYMQGQKPLSQFDFKRNIKSSSNPNIYIEQRLSHIKQYLNDAMAESLQKTQQLQQRVQQISQNFAQSLKNQRANRQKQYTTMIQLIQKMNQKTQK